MNGFINLLKAPGITSSTAVSLIKKIYNIKKVGHAGTLDPGAAGVLPIMLNKATRLFDYLQDESKEYISEFVFGIDTDTLDMQGDITFQNDIKVTYDDLMKIIPNYLGKIKQFPPRVSAININGKKAYQLHRSNVEFELPKREIKIHSIDILRKTTINSFLLKISCSKGTYIRSLCRDMAEDLNTYGYVNYLLRTKSSCFNLSTAVSIENLREKAIEEVVTPIDKPIEHLQRIDVKKSAIKKLVNGVATAYEGDLKSVFRVYIEDKFIGLGRPESLNDIQCIKVFKRFIDEEDL